MPAQNQKINEKITSTLKNKQSLFSRKLENDTKEAQVVKPEPLKILLEWKAPVRPFKRHDREYFTTIGAIALLLVVILLFLKEWLLIAVIIALMFVAYVLATVQPENVEHKITNRGIISGGENYNWNELDKFWFTEKWGQKILHVQTISRFPRRLMMLLGEADQEKLKKVLSDSLLLEEPEKTWVENASEWISRRVPLESSS